MGVLEVYRYERKFVVPEAAVRAIRDFVRAYLVPDGHMAAGAAIGYRVCSLYFDTPQFALYRQTTEGIKNRYKLRIRFYDSDPAGPAFLEVKRRTTDTIHKLRAVVRKPAAERLLDGGRPGYADLISNSDTSLRAIDEFCDCCHRLHARPTTFVSFWREAFVSSSAEGVRATFDRQIVGHAYRRGDRLAVPDRPASAVEQGVVLELKYNGRAPRWMHDLITCFGLQRRSFPKYVRCVEAVGDAPRNLALPECSRR